MEWAWAVQRRHTVSGVDRMVARRLAKLPSHEVRRLAHEHFRVAEEPRSLYRHLCSSGLFTEVGAARESDVTVRFAYERFWTRHPWIPHPVTSGRTTSAAFGSICG